MTKEEKTTTEGLREEYENWVNSFDSEELGYYSKRVVDWWLAKQDQALLQERQRMVEMIHAKFNELPHPSWEDGAFELRDKLLDALTDKEELSN